MILNLKTFESTRRNSRKNFKLINSPKNECGNAPSFSFSKQFSVSLRTQIEASTWPKGYQTYRIWMHHKTLNVPMKIKQWVSAHGLNFCKKTKQKISLLLIIFHILFVLTFSIKAYSFTFYFFLVFFQ